MDEYHNEDVHLAVVVPLKSGYIREIDQRTFVFWKQC